MPSVDNQFQELAGQVGAIRLSEDGRFLQLKEAQLIHLEGRIYREDQEQHTPGHHPYH
jgi:hypothetical protein